MPWSSLMPSRARRGASPPPPPLFRALPLIPFFGGGGEPQRGASRPFPSPPFYNYALRRARRLGNLCVLFCSGTFFGRGVAAPARRHGCVAGPTWRRYRRVAAPVPPLAAAPRRKRALYQRCRHLRPHPAAKEPCISSRTLHASVAMEDSVRGTESGRNRPTKRTFSSKNLAPPPFEHSLIILFSFLGDVVIE